jgi:hypothetical protein
MSPAPNSCGYGVTVVRTLDSDQAGAMMRAAARGVLEKPVGWVKRSETIMLRRTQTVPYSEAIQNLSTAAVWNASLRSQGRWKQPCGPDAAGAEPGMIVSTGTFPDYAVAQSGPTGLT